MQQLLVPVSAPLADEDLILVDGAPLVPAVDEWDEAYGYDVGCRVCRRCALHGDPAGCVRLPENACWRPADDRPLFGQPGVVCEMRALLALAGVPG